MERSQLESLGLWDPDAEHAEERMALLEYLLDLGATLDDLVEAGDQLPVLPAIVGLRSGHERLTLGEVAERSGVPAELVARIYRTWGVANPAPDARVFTETDVDALQTFAVGIGVMGEAATFELIRVIGSSMARVADAIVSAFVTTVAPRAVAADPVGLELARANADAVALLPALMRAIELVLRRQLEQLRRPIPPPGEHPGAFETRWIAVGFADLVGSSALAHELSIGELGHAFAEFDSQVSDTVAAVGGRVVKLIGDAVMFVAPDACVACEIALTLATLFAEHDVLPPIRCGVALGDVSARHGDYHGAVVNLAARACAVAGPGEVFVSRAVRDELVARGSSTRLDPVGPTKLKGFDEPVALFRAEQASPDSSRTGLASPA